MSVARRSFRASTGVHWNQDLREWRGRAVAAVLVAGYFVALFARGGRRAWGHFGVWVLSPSFLDLRSMTSAWECVRRGIAVLPANPCDPLQRPANYPGIWLLPAHLGLGQGSTLPLGIATAVLFFGAALAVTPRGAGIVEGCVFGLALCSPSVMLGVERGNADLLVFAVVVASVLLLRRQNRITIAGPALLLFAAILKLFPILAVVVIGRLRESRAVVALGSVLAAFGIYVLATLGTIREIRHVVPQASIYSYGIKPFGVWAENLFAIYHIHLLSAAYDWLLIGLTATVGVIVQARVQGRLGMGDDTAANRDLDFFVAGAVIYVGTFCLFQNFEYRLVFLLLTIPQLFRWARVGSVLGGSSLVFVLLALWLGAPWNRVPVVHTVIRRWEWLTRQRPLFGSGQSLSASASAQVILSLLLVVLLVATLPSVRFRWPKAMIAAVHVDEDEATDTPTGARQRDRHEL